MKCSGYFSPVSHRKRPEVAAHTEQIEIMGERSYKAGDYASFWARDYKSTGPIKISGDVVYAGDYFVTVRMRGLYNESFLWNDIAAAKPLQGVAGLQYFL